MENNKIIRDVHVDIDKYVNNKTAAENKGYINLWVDLQHHQHNLYLQHRNCRNCTRKYSNVY